MSSLIPKHVILSETKNLTRVGVRSFTLFRMTTYGMNDLKSFLNGEPIFLANWSPIPPP